jgi:hypothetical protein
LLAPSRHVLGTFFASALNLLALMTPYLALSPPPQPWTLVWAGLELASTQLFLWIPLGGGAAALGGSLRSRRVPRSRPWALR